MKIVVVDDSAFSRAHIGRILWDGGHTVYDAEGGKEGLALYREVRPAVVTVDLLMPGMSGIDFIRELKAIDPQARIIVISADVQQLTQDEVIAAGASLFLAKTSQERAILEAVEALAGKDASALIFSVIHRDAFTETMNIAMGRAAHALSVLLARRVLLQVPVFEVMDRRGFEEFLTAHIAGAGVMVQQSFAGVIEGTASLLVQQNQAAVLIETLISGHAALDRLSAADQTILSEVGNIVLNAAISLLGDMVKTRLQVSLPLVFLNEQSDRIMGLVLGDLKGETHIIILASHLSIDNAEIDSYLVFALPALSTQRLLASIGG